MKLIKISERTIINVDDITSINKGPLSGWEIHLKGKTLWINDDEMDILIKHLKVIK